jgi:hypothetical protein
MANWEKAKKLTFTPGFKPVAEFLEVNDDDDDGE